MSIKISELPVASTIGDNDIIPIVQESTTKSIKYEKFKPTIETTIDSSSTDDNPVSPKAVYDYSAPIDHASENTTYGQGTETKYGHCKTINNVTSASYVAGESLSAYQGKVLKGEIDTLTTNLQEYENTTVPELLNAKEDKSNKTNVLDSNSTETQYPNAQVTFEKYNELLAQIPTATATGNPINVQDSSNLPIVDFAMSGNATQADTPTPDTPQDIHVVTGDNIVKVVGKNLFDKANANIYNGSFSYSTPTFNTSSNARTLYIPCKPSTEYTISKVASKRFNVGTTTEIPANGVSVSNVSTGTADVTTSLTITTSASAKYFVAFYYLNGTDTLTEEQVRNSIQIEENSTATTYEPYTEQTQLLSLGSIELAKIGTYTDRIFKDSGKWYVEKNIGKVDLKDITPTLQSINSYGIANFLIQPIETSVADNDRMTEVICNRFVRQTTSIANTQTEGFYPSRNSSTQQLGTYIRINSTRADTPANLTTWLTNNPTLYYWALSTPTTTEITDTTLIGQLENILAMHTNKNVTNISIVPTGTNAEPTGEWEYRVDLGTVISNINNAIISLGGNV